ncbi:N-acetylmuramoyl-L-alanine amidase [Streptomyces sp. DSM 44915]|uniref:N-acetylmuramoyl-L-alanine amidase n=1 Tax=Streptomyces chisholmiae TaxID=3075540 RepID=A0ABU2K0D9_9ACTN|nr:N-acetylmuramoyl-L-alanine amidase [Streptomyces sp. DSM 44915]MDT0270723.1 N-acetylmuramoyl-L-alanine amidase [Streptomyces sp. DSM 44915]
MRAFRSLSRRSLPLVGSCTVALLVPLLVPLGGAAQAADGAAGAAPRAPAATQSLPLAPLTPLAGSSGDGTSGEGDQGDAGAEPVLPLAGQGLPATDTDPFALLGVVWSDAADELHGTVEVRARSSETGAWSDWLELDAHPEHAPDAETVAAEGREVRGGTAPRWVGVSDGVQARVAPEGGEGAAAPLPEGLSLELVHPGELASDLLTPVPEAVPAEGDHVGPRPGIVIRSGWGADESLRESGYVYTDTVKTAFVHHTADTNDYSCSEAPAMIRAIYRYHVVSQGWRDVGYNFFVDRCGTIYEGRAGGVIEPVLGAHTAGFNHNSMGVAVIGSFGSTKPNQDVTDALALLTAWKLGLFDVDPGGTANRTSQGGGKYPAGTTVRMNNIAGHRDGFATECPGEELYAALPTIRATASRLQGR